MPSQVTYQIARAMLLLLTVIQACKYGNQDRNDKVIVALI